MNDLDKVKQFLGCETPTDWLSAACNNLDILLIDHANCEKKAAATAMNLMYRYVDQPDLLKKMSQLAREELLHFEQVVNLMQARKISYVHLGPARYAAAMREHIRTHEPAKLVDTMIVGAFVEARSCERFAALAPLLDDEIRKFYLSLLRSEARHFEDYLTLANLYSMEAIDQRVAFFRKIENALVLSEDEEFRFHSGCPITEQAA
jgi:tRNA-(ms[2]io[6]A)-hydroxylase